VPLPLTVSGRLVDFYIFIQQRKRKVIGKANENINKVLNKKNTAIKAVFFVKVTQTVSSLTSLPCFTFYGINILAE